MSTRPSVPDAECHGADRERVTVPVRTGLQAGPPWSWANALNSPSIPLRNERFP